MEKKYQIFISSTYEDLIEERKAVQETILSMYQIPIGMEMFSADDDEQWEIIRETIDSSDYYVVIIGHRCGCLTKEGISYTRKEYEYACSIGVPTLGFIIDSNVPVKPDYLEADLKKRKKLGEFIELVKQKPVEWWENKADLSKEVAVALQKQIFKGKRPGWIRADKFNIEETQNELIQLNRKIRELEDENRGLRSQISIKLPKLELSIELDGSVLQCIPDSKIESIKREVEVDYYPIDIEDIPEDYKFVEDIKNKIQEYNAVLAKNSEAIEAYAWERVVYYAIKNYSKCLTVKVSNNGNCKANDVNVKLEFPSSFVLKYVDDIKKMKIPEPPIDIENPLYKSYSPVMSDISTISMYCSIPDTINIFAHQSLYHNYSLDGNNIKIWQKELLHTHTKEIAEYSIAAIKPGDYQIKCTIMCEEYTEPVEQIIDFHVD